MDKDNLKTHIQRDHLKIRFECNQCHKFYSTKQSLNMHKNYLHTSIDNLPCNYCSKTFARKENLKMHIRNMHKTNHISSNCLKCNKVFKSKQYLNNHILLVHNDKRFECETCNKSYSTNAGLKKHIKTIHLMKETIKCNDSFALSKMSEEKKTSR